MTNLIRLWTSPIYTIDLLGFIDGKIKKCVIMVVNSNNLRFCVLYKMETISVQKISKQS